MKAKEVYLNAFGGFAEPGNVGVGGQPGSLMVCFTITSALPVGLTLTFPLNVPAVAAVAPAPNWTLAGSDGTLATAAAVFASTATVPATPVVYYKLVTTGSDPTTIETLDVPVTVTTATGYVATGKVQFTATVAPIGTSTGTNSTLIPRYTVSESAATDLIIFTGSTTAMLVPFVQIVNGATAEGSFDTGLAIANTTKDPGTTALGITGATAQPGSFTVYFFPQGGGTGFSVASTTAGFPAGGALDATGKIPAGGTWSALLSSLITLAQVATPTIPSDFTGYVIVVTNFTNAHGLATVSNFLTYTQASPVLVLNPGPRTGEQGLNN